MLNEFYDALTQIILEYKGTVLKFVGDEVFAVFGAPWRSTTTRRSRSTAMAIQRAALMLSERLAEMEIPEVHFGIGMNSVKWSPRTSAVAVAGSTTSWATP